MSDFIKKAVLVILLVVVSASVAVGLVWEPILVVGSGRGDGTGEFYDPVDVSVDSNNSIYVLEKYNERIQWFDENGSFLETYGVSGNTELGEFDGPEGIGVWELNGSVTQVYIADSDNHRVQIRRREVITNESDNSSVINITWMAFGERCYDDCKPWIYIYFEEPGGIDVDDSGRIYVADTGYDRISIFDPIDVSDIPGTINRSDIYGLDKPKGVFVKNDRIYVADTGNNQVKILNLTGSEINSISGFNEPSSLALDSEDNIYVADTLNNRIMIFDPQGLYLTEFGEENCSAHIYTDPGLAKGQFCMPEGVEIKGDRIYVADTGNHRVQVFEIQDLPPPTCSLAGDYPPCGEVVLSEVVDFINLWDEGGAVLADVIDLINAWVAG